MPGPAQDGELVEVDPLAAEESASSSKTKKARDRQLILPPGGRQAAERAPVGAADDRLDHHAVVGVMESAQLAALVRKGAPAVLEIARDLSSVPS
mgnify:CR=1 FL=1